MIEEYQQKNNLAKEILYCGIGNYESVLHFGACDTDLYFLETLDEHELDIQYTAVDVKEEIETLLSRFEPIARTQPWITVQQSMQEFIDDVEDERYTWTILTGVFDKPLYSERQYQFIDTVVRSCFNFSDNVIFTITQQATPVYKYSIVYLFQHFNQEYDKVNVKKVEDGKYIFCINK
jgi:hypothetical protein